jgi:hypothetical protein
MRPAALRREMAALRRTVRDEEAFPPSPPAADDGVLAGEVAAAFGQKVRQYREWHGLTPEEARVRAGGPRPEDLDRALTGPPEEVTWEDLDALTGKDPAGALRRWEEVKRAAREEVRAGHRAARAIQGGDNALWERARFLAVRAELTEAWRPRDAVEQHLVDHLAQWQALLWRWQEAFTAWTETASYGPRRRKKGEPPEAVRLSEAEALERAAAKVERLHRLYLRTLKALQELRRARPPVIVRRAGQVNVGQQQVNIAR